MDITEKNRKNERSRKRNHRITLRLNDDEYQRINTKLMQISKIYSRQDILIGLILKGKVVVKSNDELKSEIKLEKALRAIEKELIIQGRNLNQVAKVISGERMNIVTSNAIKKDLRIIAAELQEIKNGLYQIRQPQIHR